MNAIRLAVLFHELYERYAPEYGYVTKKNTRVFDASSPNGRLMIRVCRELNNILNIHEKEVLYEPENTKILEL